MPVWLEMLIGALLGFGGLGLALRARPGPRQKLFLIGGLLIALVGAYLILSKFI